VNIRVTLLCLLTSLCGAASAEVSFLEWNALPSEESTLVETITIEQVGALATTATPADWMKSGEIEIQNVPSLLVANTSREIFDTSMGYLAHDSAEELDLKPQRSGMLLLLIGGFGYLLLRRPTRGAY